MLLETGASGGCLCIFRQGVDPKKIAPKSANRAPANQLTVLWSHDHHGTL